MYYFVKCNVLSLSNEYLMNIMYQCVKKHISNIWYVENLSSVSGENQYLYISKVNVFVKTTFSKCRE